MFTTSITWCSRCGRTINFTHLSSLRDRTVNKELQKLMDLHQANKCDHCKFCFGDCKGKPVFGDCVGNDNVITCRSYRKIR